jgi:hypothetical protein
VPKAVRVSIKSMVASKVPVTDAAIEVRFGLVHNGTSAAPRDKSGPTNRVPHTHTHTHAGTGSALPQSGAPCADQLHRAHACSYPGDCRRLRGSTHLAVGGGYLALGFNG